jgi:hypothetical protein
MPLSQFIISLLTEGKVAVQSEFTPFEQPDIDESGQILLGYYREDVTEMPFKPPEYSEDAALWATEYLYRTIQLAVLRDAGEEVVSEQLKPFSGQVDPSAIYSADLILRHLPRLFRLAKGLAPGDVLVRELQKTAQLWPFSSVGIELDQPVNEDIIFTDASLKCVYIDRIIREKDKWRIKNPVVVNYIQEVADEHLPVLWPGFEN